MAKSTARKKPTPSPAAIAAGRRPGRQDRRKSTPNCSSWSRSGPSLVAEAARPAGNEASPAAGSRRRTGKPGHADRGRAGDRCRSGPSGRSSARFRAAAARWCGRRGSPFWGRFTVTATWPPSIVSAAACSSCRWGPFPRSLKRSTRDMPISAWCRWRTRPTAASPTPWTMFTRLPVRICGQVEMYIHHSLLAKCSRAEVKEVYSRPQAISQCRNWLAKHLPAARTIEVTSTSTAAQLAGEKPGAAAIASPQAGVEYGLDVLAENIEDNPEQHHAVRRHRRPGSRADRQRPHGHVVPGRASSRRVGRSDEHFQAQQAEPDLDRVVSHSRHRAGILPVFRGDGGAPERRRGCGGPRPRWSASRCGWRSWGRFPATTAVE